MYFFIDFSQNIEKVHFIMYLYGWEIRQKQDLDEEKERWRREGRDGEKKNDSWNLEEKRKKGGNGEDKNR